MYNKMGFGLYLVERKKISLRSVCGLIKRDSLEDVDIGFAFLRNFVQMGMALNQLLL